MKIGKTLLILTIVSALAIALASCQPETEVITEEVVVTATPEPVVAKTFTSMVTEAMAEVPSISPEEAQQRLQQDPNVLVINPLDAADVQAMGIIPGAMNISYGSLTWKADNELPPEWREPELQDRSRPIITACGTGELGALSAKLLQDMGFTNVSNLEGGTQAWIDAGFPVEDFDPGA
jgi:rhodanese-related sulfurtransferase